MLFDQRFLPASLGGGIIPRNNIITPPQNRTDFRVQQKDHRRRRTAIVFDLLADVFNVFNRPNWTIGENEATPSQFLQHVGAQVRTMQFGFRLTY